MNNLRSIRAIIILILAAFLNACSVASLWGGGDESPAALPQGPNAGAEQLFRGGESALSAGEYKAAIKNFEALEAAHPFNTYSEKAHRDLIYAYFKEGENSAAAAASDRYIRLYPRSTYVDYAYYMKGMANYVQERGLFAKFLPMDVSLRDPGTQLEAYKNFSVLVEQFPQSKYAADAKQRMVHLRNLFAQKELAIAEFYLKRKMYVAASNRVSYLLQNYGQSPSSERALIILVQSNRALGLPKAADDALQVLRLNYPNSTFLKK